MEKTKIMVQVTISDGVDKVWGYYTKPEHIVKWNFASDDWHCPYASNDMRVGGKYSSRMEAKDGSFGFDFEAVYDEVMPNKQFAYTMLDGRQAKVTFYELNHRTTVKVNFDAETENSIEKQRGGWQAILDNFKKYTESN
ncbi:SRPBCC family protein [Arenibacter sp. ARW7G5Y1]|uniref:SRPBCC family protein n=1 Tax=Arenibacter sp. ARW7G5Y1 TaxID=2135619 RepID=UPI000D75BC38|nr:SRPBCC family protein [Arenibacter sp. ARW7G5Y1]PXX28443.1 uncharacterized protein YndB with AHSA1/START domain [Arenibacter sp. ARW7G5Y1]|tara:strand:+ start:2034 stop:2450 length:417 start_codon:yes stop_codon:yes gene_type:complete